MSDKFFVGLDLTSVKDNGLQLPISRVTMRVDDENVLTAGDDSGTELIADCPHATQEMVNDILARVKGYRYQMLSADDAALDPAAELGDGVTAGGLYSIISRIEDDGSGYASISAPGESELESEYPSAGPMTKEFNRKLAETRSSITKTAEQIQLKVEGMEGQVSSIQQYVDSITISVSNSGTSSRIELKSNGVVIASGNITMSGAVTFESLANGTAVIDGGCIKANTIDGSKMIAETVIAGKLKGERIYLEDSNGYTAGNIQLWYGNDGAISILQGSGLNGKGFHISGSEIQVVGDLIPDTDGFDLGSIYKFWGDIFLENAPSVMSDLNRKTAVGYGLDAYDEFFDRLSPVSYKLKSGTSGRRHLGLGAQDVERAMMESGVGSSDFAGFVKWDRDGGESGYSLRYEEFIPLCIDQIQKLKARVDELERRASNGG